jgi:hypothetical protein
MLWDEFFFTGEMQSPHLTPPSAGQWMRGYFEASNGKFP